jgi:primosomal protein N' (replication factor Y)
VASSAAEPPAAHVWGETPQAPQRLRRAPRAPGALASAPLGSSNPSTSVLPPLVVRVLPDVAAISRVFDYLVPEPLRDQVGVGDVVRIELHGRRVGGWIVEVDVVPPDGVVLRPLARRSGLGPPADLIDLAGWAAWRWVGRPASFLKTASPERVVAALPPARPSRPDLPAVPDLLAVAFARPRSVVRLPPATNLVHVALAACTLGHALVLCPSAAMAATVTARLRRQGVPVARHPRDWAQGAAGATVVGTRGAAWAPVAALAAVVVLDEHDEAHQQEQAPTWHARDVAIERAARAGVPCVLTSPCPSLEALAWGELLVADRSRDRAGWPPVEVVDRRDEDPRRAGLFSERLVTALRSGDRVLCVLNRTGRARLLACGACGELARCATCDAAVQQLDADQLHCGRCGATRPAICLQCGAARLKNVRAGVARVREELEALVGEPVTEVTATTPADAPLARVVVGTEAVLQRVDRADVVAFLDLDQELLAPRFRAGEQALALVARAARVAAASGPRVGGRAAGRLLLQTRLPDHAVVHAAVHADVTEVAAGELEQRALLRLPPFSAVAEVSGAAAPDFIAALGRPAGVEVAETAERRWLVRADDHRRLCDALGAVPRPPGRLRIEVDPLRA